eukprot:TRINITY_DN73506_c0_g1_i1.p1 TRINITY_DN73506_c0_g1~~TRINITY_DN73506_c0_g1_i1.p1  ORF type:complete len:300 (-),score=46.72 TRINITY_DN73506_c0_g1_i1:8-907(-)
MDVFQDSSVQMMDDAAERGRDAADAGDTDNSVTPDSEITVSKIKEDILEELNVTDSDVERYLHLPQRYPNGQAHDAWMMARRNRLTASRFAAACGADGVRGGRKATVASILAQPEGKKCASHRFGVQNEGTARNAYSHWWKNSTEVAGKIAELKEVGFCVWSKEPWLGGSPDGVCIVDGIPCGLLEVKSSPRWSDWFERDQLPVEWLYQVNGCMRLASEVLGTRISWCDLWFWTPDQQSCRRLHFDEALWEERMFPRLRQFYFELLLPRLVEKEFEKQRQIQKQRQKNTRRKQKRYHRG